MTLLAKLRADNLTARKEKDTAAASLLTTLVSEATMVGKNNGNRETTDEETLRVVKKFLDNAIETRDLLIKNGATPNRVTCDWQPIDQVNLEISILGNYMPKQLSEFELREIVGEFVNNTPGVKMGDVMKFLQKEYSGEYDGKSASQIVKDILT